MTQEDAKKLIPLVQALAEGKTIQRRRFDDDTWMDVRAPDFTHALDRYRIKPEPVEMAPLGVADFPPGSVVRRPNWPEGGYSSPTHVAEEGLYFSHKWDPAYPWERLMKEGFIIKRPGEEWQSCCKPAKS